MWRNFSIWRGRLPHWRADDVRYYVTFRHRRALVDWERQCLLDGLTRTNGRRLDLLIVCVLPKQSDLIFTVRIDPSGQPYELTDVVEKAKSKAGREIIKRTGERFSPFYTESYDRILRDETELQAFWEQIQKSPVDLELVESPTEYEQLWIYEA